MPESRRPSRPPLVLIANDQEWAARSVESILEPSGYAVLRAYNGRQAFDLACSARPDLVMLDYRLPDTDGVEVCRRLREDARFGHATPVIITTSGVADRSHRLAALSAGAWDIFGQSIDSEALLLKFENFVRAKREYDRIRDSSLIDQGSGVYSMHGLARRAREIGGEAARQGRPLACVVIGPEVTPRRLGDRFLEQIATRVLAHVSEICKRSGRVSDIIGTLGRAELAIIAPATEAAGARRLAERLQESIESSPLTIDGEIVNVKVRVGYSAVRNFADSSIDPTELLLRASTAMRQVQPEADAQRIRAFDDAPVVRTQSAH
jgi:diguanylate cyclase (GGDEF)-like protein